jgi:putative spermidine/putrescine transport system ATP-binding protein
MPNAVELRNLNCTFTTGSSVVKAVDDINLAIAPGEFFSLLGPSGSGKTTCLRLIGGFEQPTSGTIKLFDTDASRLAPYAREVNTVFQDYALFPHMNVRDNVAYALTVRGVGRTERHKRADEMLEVVALGDYGSRRPAQLSGGQRQRVALARSLINRPRILLLDEPLGALDLKLREEMQIELKALQRQLGITFIFVTHDQGEALSMSDRVAVFNHGRIEQLGTPRALYDAPRTEFVARFVGSANVISGALLGLEANKKYALRPEKISISATSSSAGSSGTSSSSLTGELLDIHFLGSQTRFEVSVRGERLTAITNGSEQIAPGSGVTLSWEPDALRPLEAQP